MTLQRHRHTVREIIIKEHSRLRSKLPSRENDKGNWWEHTVCCTSLYYCRHLNLYLFRYIFPLVELRSEVNEIEKNRGEIKNFVVKLIWKLAEQSSRINFRAFLTRKENPRERECFAARSLLSFLRWEKRNKSGSPVPLFYN